MDHKQPKLSEAVLGGGCFWCLEATYQQIEGVVSVVSGYAGGFTPHPTYMQVESQKTGHAQVVRLEFAPDTISYADILDIFWVIHDPTSLNRQAYDIGPQYRSIILYEGISQKQTAESSRARAAKLFSKPIVTEIVPLDHFYEAESYHQNYYNNHPDQGYCQIIINPKLQKLREKFTARLKPELA